MHDDDPTTWPEWMREAYEERLAIMLADDVPNAEELARECVRREAARRGEEE